MNRSAVTHASLLPFRQPLARNLVRFRLLAAFGDLSACSLAYWKRTEPEARQIAEMHIRCEDGQQSEWMAEVRFPEEAHYIKYDFVLRDKVGETLYYNEQGFFAHAPLTGHFELLQVNASDIRSLPEWSKGCVYYQIFPERFAIGNHSKNQHSYAPWNASPTRENFLGGDLRGILEHLPYLQELGVECLYLNPVFLADFNHKYATSDFFRIDPDFGTQDDLIDLVEAAHQAHIRVVLDGVFNHVGVHFAPFADLLEKGERSRYRDWFFPKCFPIKISAECYECVGDYQHMPRLRVANPETREYVLSVIRYWMNAAHIDGWRFDVADELDAGAVRYWRDQVRISHPEALFLGETWGDASGLLNEGDLFDSAMNYLLRDVLLDYFARNAINETTLDHRLQKILMKYTDETCSVLYNCLGSHDTARLLTQCRGDKTRMRMAMAFQILFPGCPAVYYGDELGMQGENDPGCRAGMIWESGDMALLAHVKHLISLRKQSKAIRMGSYRTLMADNERHLFAFERSSGNERVLVAFNCGRIPQSLDFAGWEKRVDISPQSVEIVINGEVKP